MTLLTHQQTKLQKLWTDAGGEEDHTNNIVLSLMVCHDPGSDSGNVKYTNTNNVSFFYISLPHPLTTASALIHK